MKLILFQNDPLHFGIFNVATLPKEPSPLTSYGQQHLPPGTKGWDAKFFEVMVTQGQECCKVNLGIWSITFRFPEQLVYNTSFVVWRDIVKFPSLENGSVRPVLDTYTTKTHIQHGHTYNIDTHTTYIDTHIHLKLLTRSVYIPRPKGHLGRTS